MKKGLLFLTVLCLAAALPGCGKRVERLIPDDVRGIGRIQAALYTFAPGGSVSCDVAAELTAPDAVRSAIEDLRSYPLINANRPLNGVRRVELTFFSAEEEEIGRIWIDDGGTCTSTFLGDRHRVNGEGFDFKVWESLFE